MHGDGQKETDFNQESGKFIVHKTL